MRNLSEHFTDHGDGTSAEAFRRKAEEAQERARLVRQAAMRHEHLSAANVVQ
jgi:hypothetical protein